MIQNYLRKGLTCLLLIGLTCGFSFAQVGINTTLPAGILEVNSSTQGIVLPRVTLTATNVAAPVLNPQGGTLPIGTVVYNTNVTSVGSNDVSKGIYVWTGAEWFNKFTKKQAEIFKQTPLGLRTIGTSGYQDIPNLVSRTFTADYSGTYKIEISVNYGGGAVVDNSAGDDVVPQQGDFKFTFDGVDHIIPASCYSVQGSSSWFLIWEQSSIVIYQDLIAGDIYNFGLQFDQYDSPGYESNGNSGTGRGYVAYDIPCSVEYVYIGE